MPTTCSVFLKPDRINNDQIYRCTANFDCDNFIDDVCCLVDKWSIDLASMTQNFDINLKNICTSFIDGFADIVNVHAQLNILSRRQQKQKLKPWLTKAIPKSIKTKNKLYTKCYKQNKPELIAYYTKPLNKLTFIKRLAKEQYYTSQLLKHKQDISKQWFIIKELLDQNKRCSNTTIHKLTTNEDENIESKSEISNTLNDYFVNVGANLSAQAGTGNFQDSLINKIPSNMHSGFFQPIIPVEVYHVIQNQNSKKQLVLKTFQLNSIKLLVNG